MFNSDFINKLFRKKDVKFCKYLANSLFFDEKNNIRLCPFNDKSIVVNNYDGIWLNIDLINLKRKELNDSFNDSKCEKTCENCVFLPSSLEDFSSSFETVHISNWSYCYLDCHYCDFVKEEDLVKSGHYDVYNSICQLVDAGLITKSTKIIFECGDATVHPEFDKIMYYFINYGMENIVVNTPAMRYCESISEAISKNICEVVVSFDCACPYIYRQVKSLNKFDIAVANIKKYLQFQLPSEKRVILKYTLVQGINDNQKELLDWFMYARDLGIKKLAFDIEEKWFNVAKFSMPDYLKDLILFVKNMSDCNNIEIEFYDKIDVLYKKLKENIGA